MQKITDMLMQMRMKQSPRLRMRTSTKLAIALCLTSLLSTMIALIIYFNVTSVENSSGIGAGNIIVNGKAEILPEKLSTDFEVKQLDNKNSALQNDTLIMYKKIIPVKMK